LGTKVRDILVGPACGIASGREGGTQLAFTQFVRGHEREELEENAFLLDSAAEGRHRSRRRATNVGVMGA
jgi:hypothetical protein